VAPIPELRIFAQCGTEITYGWTEVRSKDRLWIELVAWFALTRMTAIGASCSLPRVPAKVGSPEREQLLSIVGGNASSCPN
jgi:hypothetical protein